MLRQWSVEAALLAASITLLADCGGGGSGSTSGGTGGALASGLPTGGNTTSIAGAGGGPTSTLGGSGPAGGGRSSEQSGGASSIGGTPPAGSGGGTPSTGGATNAGGTTNAAGAAGGGMTETGGAAGASGGQGGATSYPMLTASQIGAPVRVASGYGLAESPLWDTCGHRLLFSDVQGDSGRGVIHALGADGSVTDFMTNTGNTNGFAFDVDGYSMILTQMGGKPGHIARRDKSGMVHVLDSPGSNLHTPDDVVVRSDGTIYFTDGDFCPIGNALGYASRLGVYMIRPGTTTLVNVGTVSGPNGIELSPDEHTLYVNGFGEGSVWSFSVAADGTLTRSAKAFASGLTNPDSLCLDAAGNLYVAVSTGLQVFHPDGSKVKLIPITSTGSCVVAGTTNCTFGGDDGKTLYITNWTTVFKVEGMPIPGLDWVVSSKRQKCN